MDPQSRRENSIRNWLAGLPAEYLWRLRAAASPEWELVRRWPGLSGPDKLAWLYLWAQSECGGQLVNVSATMIAEEQGVSSDAGVDRIENLIKEAVVRTSAKGRDKRRGRWELELLGYQELRQHPKSAKIRWDGQLELFEREEASDDVEPQPCADGLAAAGTRDSWPVVTPEGPSGGTSVDRDGGTSGGTSGGVGSQVGTEEPPEDPPGGTSASRGRAYHEDHEALALSETIDHAPISHETMKPFMGDAPTGSAGPEEPPGGTSGPRRTATDPVERVERKDPLHAGGAFAQILSGVRGEAEQLAAAHALQAAILGHVRDPDLNRALVLRLAVKVATGEIPIADVAEVLEDLEEHRRKGTLKRPPGAYVVGGFKRLFKRAESVN